MSRAVAVVVGVGPGLGAAIARRFAREGFAVALVARGEDHLSPVREAIERAGGAALPVVADAADPQSVGRAFGEIRAALGPPGVLVYNAGAFFMGGILEVGPAELEASWKANCFGAFLAARAVVPAMIEAGVGTILLTGATASLRGSARFVTLAVGKFGLRALAQSMARDLGPRGIHVAHVIVDGQIETPRMREMAPDRPSHTMLSPDAIADTYFHLHAQDRTTWTLELDLRPSVETF